MYDLPGRIGNLPKDSINGTLSGISNVPTVYERSFEWCKNQPVAEDFGCAYSSMDKEDLIPARYIQYDIAVENQLKRKMVHSRGNPVWIIFIIVIIFWMLSR